MTKNSRLVGVKTLKERGQVIIVTIDDNFMMRKWDLVKGNVIST